MKLLNIRGKLVSKNVSKCIINWDGKSLSKPQFKTKQFLKPYWEGHIVYEEFPVYGTLLRVDILNATLKIAIEVNGSHHEEFHFFHNEQPFNYLQTIKNDYQKLEWLEKNGFKLLEIKESEVDTLSKKFFLEKFKINI